MKSVRIKNMLGTLGYSNEHFSENYSVQIDGTSAIKFDYVAFSDRYLKDVSTSCIAIQEVRSDSEELKYLEGAKYLATPIVIISKDTNVRVWNITLQSTRLLNENTENIIHLYFEKNRFEFMSNNLIDAKRGYRQINIFEAAGLIDFSREATCKILSEEFENGLIAAKKYLKKKKDINRQDLNNITSITMHVISALIINSKMNPNAEIPDIFELLTGLSETLKDYFSPQMMFKYGKGLLAEIYNNLNGTINYQSVDHELLGYFYESTLLQLNDSKAESIRKEFGIYYTPRVLSQEIVLSIPFENISVEKRFVLDGTCGSGSLLLSACKRLEDLVSFEKIEYDRHEYLTRMIEGYDIDKFASEVARLSLLLYSLPYGNKWNIHAGDLLSIPKSKIKAPFFILGNPPYEEVRRNSQRVQKATAFLDKYLECLHDEGFLGIILPESFLQNDSSISQRKKILNEFDILELWVLPGQIFENNCSTIVLIAQKKKIQYECLTKIKILVRNKKSIKNYFDHHKWNFEFFINIQGVWKKEPKYKISVSPLEDTLQKIKNSKRTLGDITENVMGIMLPSNYSFSKTKVDGWVPYIANANNFRKYTMSDEMAEDIVYFDYNMSSEKEKQIKEGYRGTRLRKKYEYIYASDNKVLVKMSSTPGEIDCISALVDEESNYPSHSFFALISKDKRLSNYVLCALINSKLINAYVRKECVKRTLTTSVVRSIPIPEFSNMQIKEIERCYFDIIKAYVVDDIVEAKLIQERIDDIIFEAFGLEKTERNKVREIFDVYTKDDIDSEILENRELAEYYNVTGQVDQVNIQKMYCNVYFVELGEQKIKIERSMPGWFLRQGAEFSAKYRNGELFDIKPLVYSYLKDDEIISLLSEDIS